MVFEKIQGALADTLASSTELDEDHYGRVSTRSNAKANFFLGRFRHRQVATIIQLKSLILAQIERWRHG